MADLSPDIRYILEREDLDHLVRAVKERGYKVVGPTIRDSAITYDEVSSTAEFPAGWTDEQEGGSYRVVRRGDAALFDYAAGQHSWKRYLHPEKVHLWSAVRNGADFQLEANAPKLAFFGVRSCDLHAIFILDTVFRGGKIVDPAYTALRQNLLIVAVQCAEPGKTCFCASMNTGPEPAGGFDLALTEVLKSNRHYSVLQVGSRTGAELTHVVPHRKAVAEECGQAILQAKAAVARMSRNPQMQDILRSFQYYWVTAQSEYSTDILFKSRQDLCELYPQLLSHSTLCFGAQEVMNFLGRKLNGNFPGEIVSDLSSLVCRRTGGSRIKHRVKQNWLKMYDKSALVLRVETVINNPEDFRVRKRVTRKGKKRTEWVNMRKGVAWLFRYREVSRKANSRYLDALAVVDDPTDAKRDLDRITTRKKDARRAWVLRLQSAVP